MNQSYSKFATVVLDQAVDRMLDYGIADEHLPLIKPGVRVAVPLKGRISYGYVFSIKDETLFTPVKAIKSIISDAELITKEIFELALWMSEYYYTPLNRVFKTMLPSSVRHNAGHKQQYYVIRAKTRELLCQHCIDLRGKNDAQAAVIEVMLKAKKGILLSELLEKAGCSRSPVESLVKKGYLKLDIVRIDRSPLIDQEYFQSRAKKLNPHQKKALEHLVKAIKGNIYETHLLYGVTGSGKTEIYLQAIDIALKENKGTIMLVPEISLTAQTIERFRSRFEGNIAILHHRLSHGERYDEWHKIKRGDAKIVIGARSAIFCPVQKLGLIIVDEEHESSYKQSEEMPCYHARDVAVMRGLTSKCPVILGSATPSLESYYNVESGKYRLSELPARADKAAMPHVSIVDMKREYEKAQGYTIFSDALIGKLKKGIEQGEQSILFLNRRGYHSSMICQSCSETISCSHCAVALTYHKRFNALSCHLCGFSITPPPKACPKCHSPDPMKFQGVGTEQVERALHALLPSARTLRVDADTTRHKGSHQKLLREFGTGKADILIGTQMIAKGLHFPAVTLVGVLNSDAALNIPDYRASETVFQLITQVAGRAGRGEIPGEVIIQTRTPENRTIQLASKQDYLQFYQEEIEVRKAFSFPPITRMVKLSFSGDNETITGNYAKKYHAYLSKQLDHKYCVHPVSAAGYAKIKDRWRFHILIRGPSIQKITHALTICKTAIRQNKIIKMTVDIGPLSTYF